MRLAAFVLAALVFAAGLILDTGALLTLVAGFVWAHAATTASVSLLLVAAAFGWRRLRRRTATTRRGQAGQARRATGPRQPRTTGGRGRSRTAKPARAR